MSHNKDSIASIILIVITAMLFLINSTKADPLKSGLSPSDYNDGTTYEQALNANKLIAVNFYADWCQYCRQFAPILENLRKKYNDRFVFVLINGDEQKNAELAEDFMLESYPSLYLVNPKNNKRLFVDQTTYISQDLLEKQFDSFIRINK